jgi:hypothetical protein
MRPRSWCPIPGPAERRLLAGMPLHAITSVTRSRLEGSGCSSRSPGPLPGNSLRAAPTAVIQPTCIRILPFAKPSLGRRLCVGAVEARVAV